MFMDFPGAAIIKNLPANAGDARDTGSIPGLGRSPGIGIGNPLQYSCLENSIDRGAWWDPVHGVAELDTTEHTLKQIFINNNNVRWQYISLDLPFSFLKR